jgi:hypothetical protein
MALTLVLRRGELLGLRWVDMDLVDGVVRVEHTLQRVNGLLAHGPAKTDGSAGWRAGLDPGRVPATPGGADQRA